MRGQMRIENREALFRFEARILNDYRIALHNRRAQQLDKRRTDGGIE